MAKKKSFFASNQFAKMLVEDISQAKQRMENNPTESHRREFIRATCSAIEAQAWQLKMYVIENILTKKTTSVHDMSALKEESYAINDKGEIYVQSRGYSLKAGLRLVYSILKRHGVPIHIDFGSTDWKNIDDAVKIRNRVMHPKCMDDISVSESDAQCCYNAFLFVHNMLLTTIFGSALVSLNKIVAGGGKSRFFTVGK